MVSSADALISSAWPALSGTTDLPVTVTLTGQSGRLPSRFAVEDTAIACIGLALAAAARLHEQRGGTVADVRLDRGHVAAAVRSERYFSRDEQSQGVGFSALSRFWRRRRMGTHSRKLCLAPPSIALRAPRR